MATEKIRYFILVMVQLAKPHNLPSIDIKILKALHNLVHFTKKSRLKMQ